ncbi:MAG: hypothetical protein GWN16_10815, partial [Calditrichae bacterium]|nr:hypothetical protein [Calditrichia bacterium]
MLKELHIYRHDKVIHYLELVKRAFQIREISQEFEELVPRLRSLDIEVISPLFRNDDIVGLLCLGPNFKDEEYSEENLETLGIL